MRIRSVVLCLILLFAAVFTVMGTGTRPAVAADDPVLEFAPGVTDKLGALGREFNLDWGIYKNT